MLRCACGGKLSAAAVLAWERRLRKGIRRGTFLETDLPFGAQHYLVAAAHKDRARGGKDHQHRTAVAENRVR